MSQSDLYFRAFSRARWIAVATTRGIYSGTDDITGEPIVAPGFAVDEIGNVTITPAVLNSDGTVLTPAVLDTWWTVNLRIHGTKADADVDALLPGETEDGFKFTKSKLARFVREQSITVMVRGIRAYQFGATTNRIQLLDPRDIPVPPRVWMGGMSL